MKFGCTGADAAEETPDNRRAVCLEGGGDFRKNDVSVAEPCVSGFHSALGTDPREIKLVITPDCFEWHEGDICASGKPFELGSWRIHLSQVAEANHHSVTSFSNS